MMIPMLTEKAKRFVYKHSSNIGLINIPWKFNKLEWVWIQIQGVT